MTRSAGKLACHAFPIRGSLPVDDLLDEQLLEKFIADRDAAAFGALVRRHGRLVLNVCRRVLHHEADVEDAFQATFIVLMRNARAIGQRERLASWLYGVAYRIALNARAKASRRHAHEQPVDEARLHAQGPAAQTADWQDVRPVLDEELSQLPDKYRAPLVLCYLEGKTTNEAARQLGWPVGTVASRLPRAREMLRGRLLRRGLTLSAGALALMLAQNTATAAVPAGLSAAAAGAVTATATAKTVGAGLLADQLLKAMFWAKVKMGLFATVAVTALVAVPAYVVLTPADEMVGHYALSEGSGAQIRDASSTGNHGTLKGGVTWTAGPKAGSRALAFDGKTGHVQLAKNVAPWLGKTATVSVWVSTTQTGATDTSSPCVIGLDAVDDDDVIWGWIDGTGRIGVGAGAGPTLHNGTASAHSKQPINDGRWHHVAMTRNLATGEVQMFVDGVFQAAAVSGLGVKSPPDLTTVGRFDSKHGQAVYYFQGGLADLRIYARVLSAEEIRKLAQ